VFSCSQGKGSVIGEKVFEIAIPFKSLIFSCGYGPYGGSTVSDYFFVPIRKKLFISALVSVIKVKNGMLRRYIIIRGGSMLLRTALMGLLIIGQTAVYACLGPENVFGIRFNNGESIDVSVIENLGKEGINYYKNEENSLLKHSFRSHYNSSIMAEIVTPTDSADYSGEIIFTIDTSAVPIRDFPFGACIRSELDWLVSAGILEMDRFIRERIESSFNAVTDTINPARYFWTLQDTIIPNYGIIDHNGDIALPSSDCGENDFTVADLPPEALMVYIDAIIKEARHLSNGNCFNSHDRSTMFFLDISGRSIGQGTAGIKAKSSGIRLVVDRKNGIVKRMVRLP
jgi:hypothetical protein